MSVITGRGDNGETDLLFGRKTRKSSQLCAAVGAVDELNAALGLVRVCDVGENCSASVDCWQESLVALMGELSTHSDDLAKYDEAGYSRLSEEDVVVLERETRSLEAELDIRFTDWARPGREASEGSARLDFARTICRRAERELWALEGDFRNPRLFLNRLSDALWIHARAEALGHDSL